VLSLKPSETHLFFAGSAPAAKHFVTLIGDPLSPAVGTDIVFPAPLNDAFYVKVVVARGFEVGLVVQANTAGLLN